MTPSPPDRNDASPLTPTVLHVLLALADGPLHGYAIMQRAESESGQSMGPGAVYGSLKRLAKRGWVEDEPDEGDDPRRKRRFRLSEAGRAGLQQEIARMTRLTALARSRGLEARGA